jgi:hypothetical protein
VDCEVCHNECVVFRGALAGATSCPKCDSQRVVDGKKKIFSYLPLIPQLQRLYANYDTASWMRWAAEHKRQPGVVRDITESAAFRSFAVNAGLFDDPRNVQLILSADGINPFKKGVYSCWPLLLQILNFSPLLRALPQCQILLGIIRGPRAPTNINIYLELFVDELLVLMGKGVLTYDAFADEVFTLRAAVQLVTADYPGSCKLLHMVGSGAKHGCTKCDIVGSQRYCFFVFLFVARFVLLELSC